MIKGSEIRIGNKLLFYKPLLHEPQLLNVKGCYYNDDDGLWYVQSDEATDINMAGFKPIPLTPEWLERFGFESTKEGDDFHDMILWKHPSTEYLYCESGCFVDSSGYYGHYCDIGDVEYVHQLQNLYWCLVGEELEIKIA